MEDPAMILVEIGGKGALTADTIAEMKSAPAMVALTYPGKTIVLSIGGYDEDPRSLWDIPEVVSYVQKYARASGLANWRSTIFQSLSEDTIHLLVKTNALETPHPYRAIAADDIQLARYHRTGM